MGVFKNLDIVLQQEAQKTMEGYWARYGTAQDGVWAGLFLAMDILNATQKELGLPLEGKLDYSQSLLAATEHWKGLCSEQEQQMAHANGPDGL